MSRPTMPSPITPPMIYTVVWAPPFGARNPSVVMAAPLNESAVPRDGSLTPQNIMVKPIISRMTQVSGSSITDIGALKAERVYGLPSSWLFPTFDDSGYYPLDESFPIGSVSAFRSSTTIAVDQNHQKLVYHHRDSY